MNAPFAPPGPAADDEPQLRSLLETEARRQPPVSPDFRAGVDRRVRRSRTRLAIVVAPVVALVLVGAVLLAPRSDEATVQTAADGTESTSEAPAEPAATGNECGTVELGPERVDPEAGPLDCFIAAFNDGSDASVVVLVHGPDGGTLTQTVRTAPGKQVAVATSGSLSMKLPSFGFGTGGGIVPAEPGAGETTDCGTITFDQAEDPGAIAPETISCLFGLVTSGSSGGFELVANDATGGSMTAVVDITDHVLTVTIDGELTQSLPELVIPSDLTDRLPPNGFGLDELGLDGSGLGSFGSGFPGPRSSDPAEDPAGD